MLPPSFDPERLRQSLPLLSAPEATAEDPQKTAYLQFYRLPDCHEYRGLQHRMGYLESAGQRICCQVFRPADPRGSLFLLHGYFDHTGLYGHLIRWALGRGLVVVIFDLPGHGLSGGELAVIGSFLEYVETLDAVINATRPELPQPMHILGQSTGGAIIMEYLLSSGYQQDDCPFERIMLFAPLVRPAKWRYTRMTFLLLRPFVRKIARSFQDNTSDREFLRFVRELDLLQPRFLPIAWLTAMDAWIQRMLEHPPSKLTPLVVQGTRDETVDWRYNLTVIRQKFRRPEIFYLANGGHHLANESAEMRAQYLHWLNAHLDETGIRTHDIPG